MGGLGKLALGALGGVWGYVAAAGAGALIAGGAALYIENNIRVAQVDTLKLQIANTQAASATASLAQLQKFIDNMHVAATDYGNTVHDIDARFAALQKGLHYAKPLPVDCKPDADRVRGLANAVAAANKGSGP